MTNKTVAVFNRWLRISVGLFFMGVAIYYKEWMPALFGSIFIIQGILNRDVMVNVLFLNKSIQEEIQ